MKNITEKKIYITQIIVYIILMTIFVAVKNDQMRFLAIFIAIIITLLLNFYNIFILGNRKKKKEKNS